MILVSSQIDWNNFTVLLNLFEEKPNKRSLPDLINFLSEQCNLDSSCILRLFSLTLVVKTTDAVMLSVITQSEINGVIVPNESGFTVALLSGTFLDWQTSVVRFMSNEYNFETRRVFREIHQSLEKLGLSFLFKNYVKRSDNGGYYLQCTTS